MPYPQQSDATPSALTEFDHAWQALREHDSVYLDIEIPDSVFGVRIHIVRLDLDARGLPPRLVTLRTALFLNDPWRREFLPVAFAPSSALDALLICRRAVMTLIGLVGGRVATAEA
jgi:hypothetical protein